MISVYDIKPAFQRLLQPVVVTMRRIGATPNHVTLSAILLSISLGYAILNYPNFRWTLLMVPLGLLIRMALNAIDGMMAKQYHLESKLGEVLNELGDVVSDAVIIFPLVVIPGVEIWVILLFGILAIINEFAGVLGKAMGGDRRYDGPMGKSDRALFIGLFCLTAYYWSGIEHYANWIFGIGIGFLLISTLIRLRKAVK